MTTGNDFDRSNETELFSATLTPHRSLSRTGFLVLMAFVSVVSFTAGVAFLLMGAWPVFGFFGIDVLAIYLAFRIYFRRAKASEEIRVTPSELRVRRISHRGHVVEFTFNPLWVQLDREAHVEFGIERLYLVSKGRRLTIGSFLGAEEKASFSQRLDGCAPGRAARRDIQSGGLEPLCNPKSGGSHDTPGLHPWHDQSSHE